MSTIKMSRETRASEPIHVTRLTVGLAAFGFFLWGVAWIMLWLLQSGSRLEWTLLTAGALFLSFAVLSHLDHLRVRFGLPALIFLNIACILPVALFLPYAVDPTLVGTIRTYSYGMWGLTWLTGSLGIFLILARKEARLENRDRSPRTEIHASFFQLVLMAVGMLIYGIGFLGLISEPNSYLMGWLSFIGPAFIAISIISHVEHLTLRIGKPAVVLAVIGVAIWGGKNITRATTDLMSEAEWSAFLINGLQGISMLLGSLACLLVLVHKKAWVDAAESNESAAQVATVYEVLDQVRDERK